MQQVSDFLIVQSIQQAGRHERLAGQSAFCQLISGDANGSQVGSLQNGSIDGFIDDHAGVNFAIMGGEQACLVAG